MHHHWLVLLLLTASAASAADDHDARPIHRVPLVDAQVRADGVLDEPMWRDALVLEARFEVRPGENIPAPVRTQALLAYGPSALYVAFVAHDPDPSQIRARVSDRDSLGSDDWVGIVLGTFNDQRRMFDFICNPLGSQTDIVESQEGEDAGWDTIWDSAGRITADGYVVEMVIPFSSLRFQRGEGEQIWDIDVIRSWPRDVDHRIGLFPRDRNNNCYLCQADRLVGFAGASPGRNIELDPTVSALATQTREGFPDGSFSSTETDLEVGVTGTWGLTPDLTFTGTVNPDFSQVEADAAQLDINTQFALYFPEKRPFFLEGGDLFQTRLNAVHTRTVADPDWGAKLTGKLGSNAIGVFVARDAITNLIFPGSESSGSRSLDQPADSFALRYRRDIGVSSTLGVLATNREGDDYFNRVAGIDGILRPTPKDSIRFQALGSWTSYPSAVVDENRQPDGTFDGSAVDVYYSHDTRTWDWYARYNTVTEGFRADLGYMPQVGYDYADVGWGHTWNHDPGHWYTMLNVGSGLEEKRDPDGDSLHRYATFWFNYQGPFQSHANVNAIIGDKTFQNQEFRDHHFNGCGGFRPIPDLWLHVAWEAGDRIDYSNVRAGRVLSLTPAVEYRIGRHLVATLDHTYQQLDVDDGRLYTANVSELSLVYQFTRRSFVRGIFQRYDYRRTIELYEDPVPAHDQRLFSQVLFSYKLNARTVFFIGYSDNYRGDREIPLTQTDRALFVKLGYAWVL
ncbi:MAG: DUF5916 domain-containing protein [Acidimicrobiia bacterium]